MTTRYTGGCCTLENIRFHRRETARSPGFSLNIEHLTIGWGSRDARQSRVPVMGRTGAGKTTLLNLMAGLELPHFGRVIWTFDDEHGSRKISWKEEGPTPTDKIELHRRLLGFAFQDSTLLPYFTVGENLAYPLLLCGWFPAQARERILSGLAAILTVAEARDLTARASLPAAGNLRLAAAERFVRKYPMELSGGQRQRVALLQSYIHNPAVVLADEPTGSLDAATRRQIMEVVFEWLERDEGRLFLWVTHHDTDPELAKVDRWISVDNGTAQWRYNEEVVA